MPTPNDELFDYLERSLVAAEDFDLPDALCSRDPLELAMELANDEWSEDEAGRELARRASYDDIRLAQANLLCTLMRNPAVDIRGIRMSRILWAALDTE